MPGRPKRMRDLTPDVGVADAARVAVAQRLGSVRKQAKRIKGSSGESKRVHKLRTSCRRASAALDAFAPCLGKKRRKKAERLLKKMRRAAGEARDLDVQAGLWRSIRDGEPDAAEAAEAMLARNRARRENAGGALVKSRRKHTPKRVKKERNRVVGSVRGVKGVKRLGPFAHARLDEAASELKAWIDQPGRDAESMHKARIAEKRVRYTVEIFQHCLEPETARAVEHDLEELHDAMGDHHDYVVAERLLDEAAPELGHGLLAPLLEAVRARKAEAGRAAVRRLERFGEDWFGGPRTLLAA